MVFLSILADLPDMAASSSARLLVAGEGEGNLPEADTERDLSRSNMKRLLLEVLIPVSCLSPCFDSTVATVTALIIVTTYENVSVITKIYYNIVPRYY